MTIEVQESLILTAPTGVQKPACRTKLSLFMSLSCLKIWCVISATEIWACTIEDIVFEVQIYFISIAEFGEKNNCFKVNSSCCYYYHKTLQLQLLVLLNHLLFKWDWFISVWAFILNFSRLNWLIFFWTLLHSATHCQHYPLLSLTLDKGNVWSFRSSSNI